MSSISHNKPLYPIVIAHYLLAGLFFFSLTIMVFFTLQSLSGHYFQPKVLAITHAAALGWGTMIIFGALYQLLPVILEVPLYSTKLSWVSFVLFVPGIMLLVYCFWIFDPGIGIQIASVLIFSAIMSFNVNVFFTLRFRKQESIFQEFIITACVWLTITALLGVLMVFNFRYPFLQKDHLYYLRLHAHMGIVGWFLMLIIGVSAKLIPMFLVATYQEKKLLSLSYYFINAALLSFLVSGFLHGIGFDTYVIVLIGAIGIAFYLTYLFNCFVSRMRKDVDLPMVKTLLSFVFLAAAIVVLPFILYYHLQQHPFAVNMSMLYGMLIFMGWISALALGQTFKTLPFIVWLKHYEKVTGKVKTPVPADLLNNLLLNIQFFAFLTFVAAFIVGFLFDSLLLKLMGSLS
jgi:cbb3-type cytochrome oxidase subunit 1